MLFLNTQTAAQTESSSNYLKITLSPSTVKTGQTYTVFLESPNPLKTAFVDCFGKKQVLYRVWAKKHTYTYRSFLAVSLYQKKGNYKIVAEAVDSKGESLSVYELLEVTQGNYKTQLINLPKKKRSLLNSKMLREEGKILGERLKVRDKRVYFSSHFSWPVKGRLSSPFGARRKYNDGQFSSYHKGIDIANRKGVIVKASNGGKVSLVAAFKSNGNLIVINHGHGIASIYSHLSEFLVKEGEWVKMGQPIGKIGSTGISTGPHLHFGISVNDIRVDPMQWLKKEVALHYDSE